MSIYKKVINKHGGQAAFARLTGIAPTTVADHYHGRTDTAAIRLLYALMHMAGEGTIKAAARRAAANNDQYHRAEQSEAPRECAG